MYMKMSPFAPLAETVAQQKICTPASSNKQEAAMQLVNSKCFLMKSTNKCNFGLNIFQIMMLVFLPEDV